jgi:hypothetical protein
MPERWVDDLQRLRTLEPSADVWERSQRGPRGDGMPPRRDRVVAGVVALVVFAAAGTFAWRALRPGESERVPVGPAQPRATVTFLGSDPEYPGYPSASLTFEGETRAGQVSSYGWDGAIIDTEIPAYVDPLELPAGALLEIAGDASSVEGEIRVVMGVEESPPVSAPEAGFPWELYTPLDLTSNETALDLPPGRYVLAFEATWPEGTAPFYFPIEIADAIGAPPHAPEVLVRVEPPPDAATDPDGVLTFEGVEQPGLVESFCHDEECTDRDYAWDPVFTEVPPGTTLAVEGTPFPFTVRLGPFDGEGWSHGYAPTSESIPLGDVPDRYRVHVVVEWENASAHLLFAIEVVDPSAEPERDPSGEEGTAPAVPPEDVGNVVVVEGEALPVEGAEPQVVCRDGATEVIAAAIAEPDGAHVVVENAGDGPAWFAMGLQRPEVGRDLWSVALLPEPGSWSVVVPAPPNIVQYPVACGVASPTDSGSRIDAGDVAAAMAEAGPLAVQDPAGVFVDVTPACWPEVRHLGGLPAGGYDDPFDPIAFARALPGVLGTDVVEPAGYTESVWHWVRVVRGGSIVAWFWVSPAGDGHVLAREACVGSGIGGA